MRLVVLARSRDGLVDYVEDMQTAFLCLCEGFLERLVAESVALDVHPGGGDALGGSGYLEVHVAEVVLIAEDVGEYGIFHVVGI